MLVVSTEIRVGYVISFKDFDAKFLKSSPEEAHLETSDDGMQQDKVVDQPSESWYEINGQKFDSFCFWDEDERLEKALGFKVMVFGYEDDKALLAYVDVEEVGEPKDYGTAYIGKSLHFGDMMARTEDIVHLGEEIEALGLQPGMPLVVNAHTAG